MDETTARDRLSRGLYEIQQKRADWEIRQRYIDGDQDLPFAPEGVNEEYLSLRQMALSNVLELAMNTPIQRLSAGGFRTGRDADADQRAWDEVWQPNKLDARQRIVYKQMMVHGRGLMSVWPNQAEPKSPVIRPENGKRVHCEMDPEDPFSVLWTVKTFSIAPPPPSTLILPDSVKTPGTDVAIVYDRESFVRFERKTNDTTQQAILMGGWEVVKSQGHSLGDNPFVPFDLDQDADGKPKPRIDNLIPAQDALNTIRFNTLLAMQFSAFRQRVFVGYDPVVRDANGEIVWQKEDDGVTVKIGPSGQPLPVVNSPGRIGVDRALVFPGELTKVFDLQESNLDNYIKVMGDFLTQFFALAQIPPQYLLSRMANLSGDALTAAESTLASLVVDLQTTAGESLESVMRLANRARGETQDDVASYVIWADAEARSFAQTVDAIVKLVSVGFPTEAAFEMIPGATQTTVKRWMGMRAEEADNSEFAQATRALTAAQAPNAAS